MNNRVLVGLVIVLASALILQTAYVMGTGRRGKSRGDMKSSQLVSGTPRRAVVPEPVIFEDMRDWDPFAEMEMIQRRMHRAFADSFSRGSADTGIFRKTASFEPDISIHQKDGAYILQADLPGMEKSAINVAVRGRELVVSGERQDQTLTEDGGFYRQELNYGSFSRSIMLPEDAKTDQISSQYQKGVLIITVPRERGGTPTPEPVRVPVQ